MVPASDSVPARLHLPAAPAIYRVLDASGCGAPPGMTDDASPVVVIEPKRPYRGLYAGSRTSRPARSLDGQDSRASASLPGLDRGVQPLCAAPLQPGRLFRGFG